MRAAGVSHPWPIPGTQLERAEQLAERLLPDRTPKRRMLVIVNPYATTVSDRLRNLVVYALQARYDVEAVDTEKRNHATQLCREAAEEGYDVVVAFGGDGTVNEAANGLAGSDTPLTCLPGGATNVFHRAHRHPHRRGRGHRAPAARWPTTSARGGSTWAGSTTATSPSPRASAWTPAWSSAWTPTRG